MTIANLNNSYPSGVVLQKVEQARIDLNFRAIVDILSYLIGHEVYIADTEVGSNTDFVVQHSLGRIPNHASLLITDDDSSSDYIQIRPGTSSWTTSDITLQCNVANAAFKIRIC